MKALIPFVVCSPVIAFSISTPARAGAVGDWSPFRDANVGGQGHDWAVIGDPGNHSFLVPPEPGPPRPPTHIGRVNYRYRISKTEVTTEQWFGFIQAFAPYIDEVTSSPAINPYLNGGIAFDGRDPDGVPTYRLIDDLKDRPMGLVGWGMAALYANWLHNGRESSREAFTTGAYDIDLFGEGRGESGIAAHRNEGARYFIPTRDEWTKAVYWDPDRFGEGEGGFWMYPDSSDTAPEIGLPGEGGETSAAVGVFMDVGSYPDVMSPWELLDASGSLTEYLETPVNVDDPDNRYLVGSNYLTGGLPEFVDKIGFAGSSAAVKGLRIASVVPSPPMLASAAIAAVCLGARRRR